MASFYLTELAELDFDNIGSYTQEVWGYDQAQKYLTELDAMFSKLLNNPALGRQRNDIRQNLLAYPCNKHMIFFRRDAANNVEILRILGQSMDFQRHL